MVCVYVSSVNACILDKAQVVRFADAPNTAVAPTRRETRLQQNGEGVSLQ